MKFFITILTTLLILVYSYGLEMEKYRPVKADIVLAIDTAVGNIGRSPDMLDVQVIKHFLRKITMAFVLSPDASRIAVVEFAASARIRLPLVEGIDSKALDSIYDDVSEWYDDEGIDRMGSVNYEAMFRRIYENIFTGGDGDRPEVPNLVMVLTIVPSIEEEDPSRWRSRARSMARGKPYNYSDPDGVVITTGYASQRGAHLPKFTMTRGSGSIVSDAWYYQDFNEILPYSVIHLRHALRNAWLNSFYSELQLRLLRTFDYTTCREDPIFARRKTDENYASFVADIIFAIEIDRSAPISHHEDLRTLLLNMTRYLPISQNLMRFSAAEFDRSGSCQLLANAHDSVGGCCMNKTSLFRTLVEKWVPQASPNYRCSVQASSKELVRVEGATSSSNLMNLRLLRKHLQKACNQSGRIPQIVIVAMVFSDTTKQQSLDGWYRKFLDVNGANAKGGPDAIILTSGKNKDWNKTYTMAISPFSTTSTLALEKDSFEETRGLLYTFVANVTKTVITRCYQCYFDSNGQCVIDVREKWQNVSGIDFLDGRFCENITGVSRCQNERICVNECERRPWTEWSRCSPIWPRMMNATGLRWRKRKAINVNDSDGMFYKNCPKQKTACSAMKILWTIIFIPVILTFIFS